MKHRQNQNNMVTDIGNMHKHYGFDPRIQKLTYSELMTFLNFRINFLQEELDEIKDNSTPENFVADEVVDGLIDLMVVAIGTLDSFDIDAQKAWDRVHEANMSKKAGIKEGRPNPLKLPDLMKPDGWTAPSHLDNLGKLKAMETESKRLQSN